LIPLAKETDGEDRHNTRTVSCGQRTRYQTGGSILTHTAVEPKLVRLVCKVTRFSALPNLRPAAPGRTRTACIRGPRDGAAFGAGVAWRDDRCDGWHTAAVAPPAEIVFALQGSFNAAFLNPPLICGDLVEHPVDERLVCGRIRIVADDRYFLGLLRKSAPL
jgi:hypothetical protein